MARFSGLNQWLDWQQTLHPTIIDMGLERIVTVVKRLDCELPCPLITVGGTNGKGSTVSMLASIYQASNYTVGCFTSPHIQYYNERITINGKKISDEAICKAFDVIDEKRGEISLTFFEFSTLAAWWIFCHQKLDLVLMEVGLGGRLDAVNAFDSLLSIVTTVDLDHEEWLGHDRESVGKEKAGIYRAGCVAICGDPNPPDSLKNHANHLGSKLYCQGVDYSYSSRGDQYQWALRSNNTAIKKQSLRFPEALPMHQQQNLATVLMTLNCMQSVLPVNIESDELVQAVLSAALTGRIQTIQSSPEIILDVAHNCEAVSALSQQMLKATDKKTHAVFSALSGKNINAMLSVIADQIDVWYIAPLDTELTLPIHDLQCLLKNHSKQVSHYENIWQAFQSARQASEKQDRILIFGSFYTVAAVLEGLQQEHNHIR